MVLVHQQKERGIGVKKVMKWKLQKNRTQTNGQPRIRWKDQIIRNVKVLEITEWTKMNNKE